MLYAAYGSNMNLSQMKTRCPGAEVYAKGYISGFRLVFRGIDGKAYATLVEDSSSSVPVLLWELTPAHEKALDDYEDYPTLYTKVQLPVKLPEEGRTETAMLYLMTEKAKPAFPEESYIRGIREAYSLFGLDPAPIEEALHSLSS